MRQLLRELEDRVLRKLERGTLVWLIDGKPLPIGGASKDRQAGYGRAASCKAKGYKLHAMVGADKSLPEWRLAPMNTDERKMAKRMLQQATIAGYVVADANYDSNKLHATCDERGNLQLVAPRRYGPGRGHGHRKQTPGRLRSKEILENPNPQFGMALLTQRDDIERYFGNLTNWGGGLSPLPPWARGYRRVHRWVQAKLIINTIKRAPCSTTYVG
ncbi:MAG: transposase [Pirellulales bacterium]|nr:transposase [Pirellulales bacterium]